MPINILVISAVPWNTNTNFGSSYSGIFRGMDDITISNLFFSEGEVNDDIVSHAFQISEKNLMRNLVKPNYPTGRIRKVNINDNPSNTISASSIRSFGKRHKLMILYLARDLLWRFGRWNSAELENFIRDVHPDIIFLPINGSSYPNRIALEIAQKYKLPIVGYISDDNYTMKVFSISPLFWIRRLIIRHYVGEVIKKSEQLYVISEKQKDDYDKIFGIHSKILTKGMIKNDASPEYMVPSEYPIKMVYTGNLGIGRWKSLALIADAIDKMNSNDVLFELDIYSATKLTNRMRKSLDKRGVKQCGFVPAEKIADIQKCSDILIHIESIDMRNKWSALYGFSTKIVDYMSMKKPIFAFGDKEQASIQYLSKNRLALVANSPDDVRQQLELIYRNVEVLNEYANRAYEWGCEFHNRDKFQEMIKADLNDVLYNN